jgi:hypothetical protein
MAARFSKSAQAGFLLSFKISIHPSHPPTPCPFLLPVIREGGRGVYGSIDMETGDRDRRIGWQAIEKKSDSIEPLRFSLRWHIKILCSN